MSNPRIKELACLTLALTSGAASSVFANQPDESFVGNEIARHAQTVEPKAVPGIPDVLFETNSSASRANTAPPSPTRIAANADTSQVRNTAEPKPVPGVPDTLMDAKSSHDRGDAVGTPPAQAMGEPEATSQAKQASEAASEIGWYAGASLGRGGLDTGYQRTLQTIFSTGATTVRVVPHAEDAMWKVYVGYRLSPRWSIEGGYWNFGKESYSATISAPVATTMNRDFRIHGVGADVAFRQPISDSFAGFAKLGVIQISANASSATPGGGLTSLPSQSNKAFNMLWGIGGEYAVNPGVALRFEYETVVKAGDNSKFGTANIELWTVGAAYKF